MGHHTDSAKYRRSLKRRRDENVGGEAGVERGTSIDDSNISCRPCLLRSLDVSPPGSINRITHSI